jgi:acyl-coenzyme A thioesterase PaaI-like protein
VTDFSAKVAAVKAAYEDCFGCGRANPIGLHLDEFTPDGEGGITATFRPRPEYRGFAGVLHGGIVAAALDETLAWTAILLADAMTLTARLELRYRNPAPPDRPLRVSGRIVEQRGRRLVLAGDLTEGSTPIAQAEGLFLVVETPPGPGAT